MAGNQPFGACFEKWLHLALASRSRHPADHTYPQHRLSTSTNIGQTIPSFPSDLFIQQQGWSVALNWSTHPSRKTVSFRFPLKDYASKLTDLRSPSVGAPLANFQSRRSIPLFGQSADPRPIFPTRAASPNAPFYSRLQKFPSEPVDARRSGFMLAHEPRMNPASRAAPR
jgi:hypothetical protein